jgi:hypothetical protein
MRATTLFLFLMLGLCSVWMLAQDATSDTKGKTATRTITGCLQKGDSSDEFNLMSSDGSTWEVKSTRANLADHVGHTVNVTGVVEHNKMHNMKEDAKDTAHDTGMKKDNREHGHLTVTDVQMVSGSCSQ